MIKTRCTAVFAGCGKTAAQIKQLAYFDGLTQLPNRELFKESLSQALELAERYERALAVLFLDLDDFKEVNDTWGHAIGDLLLQRMADLLKGCLRGEDTVARLGGDEFILILPGIQERQNAIVVAEKINKLVRQPVNLDGKKVQGSISIGISIYPDDGENPKELLNKADAALYSAKKEGRNGYRFASAAELSETSK